MSDLTEDASSLTDEQPSVIDLPTGFYRHIEPSAYYARHLGLARTSTLRLVSRSAAHYRAWLDGATDDEDTPALAFGRAFHFAALEPEKFALDYAVERNDFGDCRKTENKRERDAWRAQVAGRELLSAKDAATTCAMVGRVMAHPVLGAAFGGDALAEVTLRWDDEQTGLPCLARPDLWVPTLATVFDLKSCRDAREGPFGRDVASHCYHWQEAHYRAGFEAIGWPIEHFVFAAVEKTPPYEIGLWELDESALIVGRMSVREHMSTLARCSVSNTFEGYPTGIRRLKLAPWVKE
jgi:hypothetical protein